MAGMWYQLPQPVGQRFPTFNVSNARVERSGNFSVARGNRYANLEVVDCNVSIGTSGVSAYGSEIGNLTAKVDRISIADAVYIAGGATPGSKLTYANRIRHLHLAKSDYATTNNPYFQNPVCWLNSLGDQNAVDRISGSSDYAPFARGATPDQQVIFGDINQLKYNQTNIIHNAQTTPMVAGYEPIIKLTSTNQSTAAVYNVTMPHANVQVGQTVRLLNTVSSNITFRLNVANTRMKRAVFLKAWTSVLLRSDGAFWNLVEGGNEPLIISQSGCTFTTAGGAIPAGGSSDEFIVTAAGVLAGDMAQIGGTILPAKCSYAYRAQNGSIAVWVKNDGASAATIAAHIVNFVIGVTY